MFITELTALLHPNVHQDENGRTRHDFVGNISIAHWHSDLYVATYRHISYRVSNNTPAEVVVHPWKIWDNGFKYLYPDPERMYLGNTRRNAKHGNAKYRASYGPDLVRLTTDKAKTIPSDFEGCVEWDSTGLAILRYAPKTQGSDAYHWTLLAQCPNLFGAEMNQDTRVMPDVAPNEFILTYNAFFETNKSSVDHRKPQKTTQMMCRRLSLQMRPDQECPWHLYLSEERAMIDPRFGREVEKNCVFIPMQQRSNDDDTADTMTSYVLYNMNAHGLTIYRDNDIFTVASGVLQRVLAFVHADAHDKHRILFSLGSPPVRYGGKWLAVGHVKVHFRDVSYPPIADFVKKLDWSQVYRHGKWIYAMFFFEFLDNFVMTRMSRGLLPTCHDRTGHLPYLVCFPCGLTFGRNPEELLVSYGEGDCRSKIWSLTTTALENMLFTEAEWESMGRWTLEFVDMHQWNTRPKIFHYGYFHDWNTGDDMFVIAFRYLYSLFHCQAHLTFSQQLPPDPERYTLLVVGGGDVIAPYFIHQLQEMRHRPPTLAISVGIPYTRENALVSLFDHLILRNPRDVEQIRQFAPAVRYGPDLGFLLPRIYPNIAPVHRASKLRVGITVPRTFYQNDSLDYVPFLESFASWIRELFTDHSQVAEVVYIPFCVQPVKHSENDAVIHEQLRTLSGVGRLCDVPLETLSYVETVYREVAACDLMVCGRFHANVFCLALGVPFLSFSCSRKCQQLMEGYGLGDWYVPLHPNTDNKPKPLDAQQRATFLERVSTLIETRDHVRRRLADLYMNRLRPEVDDMIARFRHHLMDYKLIPQDERDAQSMS